MSNHAPYQIKPMGYNELPLYLAEITYKGRVVATLQGRDRDQLSDRAHRYAVNLNYHRAVVQVKSTREAQSHD